MPLLSKLKRLSSRSRYVGKEVDSIIRWSSWYAVHMTKEQATIRVNFRAEEAAEERNLDALWASAEKFWWW